MSAPTSHRRIYSGEAGASLLAAFIEQLACRAGFHWFHSVGTPQQQLFQRLLGLSCPPGNSSPRFGCASAECDMVLLVQWHKLVYDGLVWSGQSACSNPFPVPAWFPFGFLFSGELKRPFSMVRHRYCDFEGRISQELSAFVV